MMMTISFQSADICFWCSPERLDFIRWETSVKWQWLFDSKKLSVKDRRRDIKQMSFTGYWNTSIDYRLFQSDWRRVEFPFSSVVLSELLCSFPTKTLTSSRKSLFVSINTDWNIFDNVFFVSFQVIAYEKLICSTSMPTDRSTCINHCQFSFRQCLI